MLLQHLRKVFSDQLTNVAFSNLQGLASLYLSKDATPADVITFLSNYEEYAPDWSYTSIIIDEGQDFEEEHIILLYDIAKKNSGSFYVFYDKNQLVQQSSPLDWVDLMECRLVLTLNCRNTKSIAETAGNLVGIDEIKMAFEISGKKPRFYIEQSKESLSSRLAAIIREYTDSGIALKQIVIVTVKTLESSVLAAVNSVGKYRLTNTLDERGVLFTSARKFKGLESDIVIVVDVSVSTFDDSEQRKLFYVGASRAKNFLDIVAVMTKEDENTIASILSGKAKTNPRMAIMNVLRAKVMG